MRVESGELTRGGEGEELLRSFGDKNEAKTEDEPWKQNRGKWEPALSQRREKTILFKLKQNIPVEKK